MRTSTTPEHEDFPTTFGGPVLRAGESDYERARRIWNARAGDQYPALIVQAESTADVRTAVRYAAEHDLPVAIRGGGHGIDGYAVAHHALVIDMSRMKDIVLDPETGVVEVGAGVLLGELNIATQAHGWALPAGTISEVGVAGLTLGGGIGHITRRFGATVDHLLSAEVVTADGRLIVVSESNEPELFWGLRGAGQGLVVVTRFTFQTRRVGPEVIFGPMIFDGASGVEFMAGLQDALAASPSSLSITPLVRLAPPAPVFPPELVGKPIVAAALVYTGPPEEFDAAMVAVRELPAPLVSFVGPTPWTAVGTALDQEMPSGRRWGNGGAYLPALTRDVAEIIIERVTVSPPGCEVHIPVMGSATFDTAEDAMAFSREGAEWLYEVTAQWDDPALDAEYEAWVSGTTLALAPLSLRNGYINLNSSDGPGGIAALYGAPEKWARIQALKRAWDPDDRFRYTKADLTAADGVRI